MLQTETPIYDEMSKNTVDSSKWKIMSFPMGNGENWTWAEPRARLEAKSGGLALTIDPFTRKHDTIHIFDDPKQLYGSTRNFPISNTGITTFEVEMGAEAYRSNPDDLRDGFAGFILMDFTTGMIFDFVTTKSESMLRKNGQNGRLTAVYSSRQKESRPYQERS